MRCHANIARNIVDAGADYLLAVKDDQPTLHADIESYFDTAPESVGKEHGSGDPGMKSPTIPG